MEKTYKGFFWHYIQKINRCTNISMALRFVSVDDVVDLMDI